MLLSLYELIYLLHDTLVDMKLARMQSPPPDDAFSFSLLRQWQKNPQTFIVGGITFVSAIQFLSLGFLSLQNKRYFEELFHLGTFFRKQKLADRVRSSIKEIETVNSESQNAPEY